jgi:hypothetical protein
VAAEESANGLVGAAHAEVEQLALNPAIAAAAVLASQAQDESRRSVARPGRPSRGRRANRAHLRWTRSPCQRNRSGADEDAEPSRAGQASAETCEHQTIRPQAWPLDLALEDAQLVPEDQELEPEVGVRAAAIHEGINEQTEDGIEESEKHDRASWQVGSSRSTGPASTAWSFLTAQGDAGNVTPQPMSSVRRCP